MCARARGAAQPVVDVTASAVKEANTTLSAKSAVEIFVAKHSHTSRDALSCKLAVDYGITSKSVRGTHACVRLRAADLCWGSRRRGAWRVRRHDILRAAPPPDIWNMRTWGWATLPHWTDADKRRYLEDRLCPACRRRGARGPLCFLTARARWRARAPEKRAPPLLPWEVVRRR